LSEMAKLGALEAPRIAVVSHSHPSVSKGGAEIAAYTLFKGLKTLGCDAIFIAACDEESRGKVALASEDEYAVFTRGELFEHFFQLGSAQAGEDIETILRERRVQLVNFHHFTRLGLGALRRIRAIPDLRLVFTIHEFLAICHHHGQMVTSVGQRLCEKESVSGCVGCFPSMTREDFVLRKKLFLETLGSFDAFVSPSLFLAERFCAWGLARDKFSVIENGLARLPKFSAAHNADNRGAWTFGYFGQINPFKGVDVIIDAAERLHKSNVSNVKIKIYGNLIGQGEQFLAKFKAACESGLVEYFGPYDNNSVGRLMADCDYVVVASKWWENSPVVIQEAFAVGCPVVCSDVGGMAEKVKDGVSGKHFRLGDGADLARAMVEASSEEVYFQLIEGVPKPFDDAEMARRYLAAFAGRRQAPPPEIVENEESHVINFA
jgi:glycosyltransferase involved in cell wall biosynthesis